ncbi:hypothetical protein [Rubrivivax rivuli]|uniref:Uncharacterized protein n=1 Tax=Rubrivivax rivuli TaxID=1862385 RepID=A0A437RQL7_9BURK|nr:hypothetical protein [Rubrivivax rivuli]RVU49093.1 hypothetical protein EOE66_00450 [Rubrivivax rivuli]
MKKWMLAAAAVPLLAGLAVLVAVVAALQAEPSVSLQAEPVAEDVARALALVRAHDPRRATPGRVSALRLSERDVEVLLNQAALRRHAPSAGSVSLQRGSALVKASLHLPANPFGRWLNVQLRLRETGGLPALDELQVGRLPLPAWAGEKLLRWAAERAGLQPQWQAASEVVRRVSFGAQQLAVVYAWQDDSSERLLGGLVPPDQQQRLRVYAEHLAAVTARQSPGWSVPLPGVLAPLFALARQRSAAPGADAAAENRAALVVLTLYVNGRTMGALLPAARNWPQPRPMQVTLDGRADFPRHLLVSAALAAEGTSPLSRAIGVYKELADSRGGSGFSFNDMAANRAGIRLGERAVRDPQRLQAALAAAQRDGDVMPPWQDLAEFMDEASFVKRFGGVGAPAYEAQLQEIDRRVAALPVLR